MYSQYNYYQSNSNSQQPQLSSTPLGSTHTLPWYVPQPPCGMDHTGGSHWIGTLGPHPTFTGGLSPVANKISSGQSPTSDLFVHVV